jgi:RNA polymerase sigma-70 factor (ECF subfamily)
MRFAYKLCADSQLASDVVQDVWLKSMKSLLRLNDPRTFKSWIYRAVRWRALDQLRQQKKRADIQQSIARDVQGYESPEPDQSSWTLNEMIASLPEDEKQVIYLFYHEDMRLSEIAIVQDVPLGTVKTRLFRAKAKIKTLLEKQDEYR